MIFKRIYSFTNKSCILTLITWKWHTLFAHFQGSIEAAVADIESTSAHPQFWGFVITRMTSWFALMCFWFLSQTILAYTFAKSIFLFWIAFKAVSNTAILAKVYFQFLQIYCWYVTFWAVAVTRKYVTGMLHTDKFLACRASIPCILVCWIIVLYFCYTLALRTLNFIVPYANISAP